MPSCSSTVGHDAGHPPPALEKTGSFKHLMKTTQDIEVPEARVHAGIPHNLIHIVPSHEGLSDEFRHNLHELAQANPQWRQTVFSDEEAERFVAQHYGARYTDALARIDPAYGPARSDLMRYLIMYKLGGVYLDTKSGLDRPLSQIVREDDQFIVSQWQNGPGGKHEDVGFHPELGHVPQGEYQNWVIVTRPGHPFLAAVIDAVLENIERYAVRRFGTGKNGVLRVTGPIAYTLAIHPLLDRYPHRRVVCVEAGLLYAVKGGSQHHVLSHKLHYSRLSHPVVMPPRNAHWLRHLQHALSRAVLMQLARLKHWNRRRLNRRRVQVGRGLK